MASLSDYLQQLYQPPATVPGFKLASIAQGEGDLTAGHNLEQRGFDVAGQRLGLQGQQLGLDAGQLGLNRQDLALNGQQNGLDRQQLGLNRQGIQDQLSRAQRDYGYNLSALQGSFAARGAASSSARRTAETRLGQGLADFTGDQNRALSGIGLQEQGIGLQDQRLGLQGQGLSLQQAGLGLKTQGLGLDQTDLGLDREKSNLNLASGLGQFNLQKIYAANGVQG